MNFPTFGAMQNHQNNASIRCCANVLYFAFAGTDAGGELYCAAELECIRLNWMTYYGSFQPTARWEQFWVTKQYQQLFTNIKAERSESSDFLISTTTIYIRPSMLFSRSLCLLYLSSHSIS